MKEPDSTQQEVDKFVDEYERLAREELIDFLNIVDEPTED